MLDAFKEYTTALGFYQNCQMIARACVYLLNRVIKILWEEVGQPNDKRF